MTNTLHSRRLGVVLVIAMVAIAIFAGVPNVNASPTLTTTPQTLPFSQNWATTTQITTNDDWTGVPGIVGYLGDGLTGATGVDPQTVLAFGTGTQDVIANQTNTSISNGGVAEFEITDPVVALQGSGSANAPFIVIHVNSTAQSDIAICYNVRDLDGSTDNSVQQVALQYRVGNTGDFTNVPAGYIADATGGPSQATLVTPVNVTLPAGANNAADLQIRVITTNAPSNDEWVGIDDIRVGANGNCEGGPPVPTVTPGGPTVTPTSSPTATATPTTVPGNACGDPATPIYTIQGSGAASPADGMIRTIEGVVVGDYQGATSMNGFNVQERVGDGNPATSDGIFVFAASAPDVNIGDVVRVTGTVDEYFDLTELTNVTNVSLCGTAPVPTPVAINLPVAAISDLERYEGMYITFPQTLYVTEVFGVGRYGEVGLSVQSRRFQPTNYVEPGAPANAAQSLNDRSRILLDDSSSVQNPAVVPYLAPDNTLRPNDTTPGLTGTLSYGFDFYRVYPTQAVTFTRANPRDLTPEDVGGTVKVASFNVLNYFTTIDNGSNGARGADSAAEFTRQRTKIIEAIVDLDADVIGLMEIENNSAAITDLLAGVNISSTVPYTIAPMLPGTIGTDAIKLAIIYRPSVINAVGNVVIDNNAVNNRPTVAQTFEQNGEVFTVVINHFKSKGCGGATGADTDQGDGQSCFNATRVQQANRLVTFINQIATTVGDNDFVLLGDFNSYAMEDPLDVLRAAGFVSLSQELLPPEDQYSYIFFGQSGELDHMFINSDFGELVDGYTIWHINSDEPIDLDYNDNILTSGEGPADFNQPYLYQPNAFRSSDHDPLLLGLNLAPEVPTVATFSPSEYEVVEANTTVTVTVALTPASNTLLAYAYSTVDGSATANEDYVPVTGTLVIPAGTTSDTFTVEILNDTVVEGDETIILELVPTTPPPVEAPGAAVVLGDPITGTITIQEGALTTVDFSLPNYTVTEANTTTTVTVTLSQALDIPATLGYFTTDGTATAGSDYTAVSSTLTIPAGQTTGTFTVQILDDTVDEADETILLTLSPSTLGLLGDVVTGTITILDNDLPPTAVTVATLSATAENGMPLVVSVFALVGLALVSLAVVRRQE